MYSFTHIKSNEQVFRSFYCKCKFQMYESQKRSSNHVEKYWYITSTTAATTVIIIHTIKESCLEILDRSVQHLRQQRHDSQTYSYTIALSGYINEWAEDPQTVSRIKLHWIKVKFLLSIPHLGVFPNELACTHPLNPEQLVAGSIILLQPRAFWASS